MRLFVIVSVMIMWCCKSKYGISEGIVELF